MLENKYKFNFRLEFFSPLSAFYFLTVKTLFNACSSSIVPFSTSNFVCKVNNIWQNKLDVKEWEVKESEALKKALIVNEQNTDNLVEELLSSIERELVLLI